MAYRRVDKSLFHNRRFMCNLMLIVKPNNRFGCFIFYLQPSRRVTVFGVKLFLCSAFF